MKKKIAIVSTSRYDASVNIKNNLLNLLDFEKRQSDYLENDYYLNEEFLLYETDKSQLELNNVDEVIKKVIKPKLIVFPSKHSGENNKKIFSVHPPGNPSENADFGGKKYSLSKSAPFAMKKALKSLKKYSTKLKPNYGVTLERTHHGPSNVDIPCFFIEIGSSSESWNDKFNGKVVAKAISDLKEFKRKGNICISLGGGHYSPRQTRLLLESETNIGHIIPNFCLNEKSIKEAIENTPNCEFIHLSGEKTKSPGIKKILSKFDLPKFRENTIRRLEPIPLNKWKKIIDIENEADPFYFGKRDQKLSLEILNKEFINYVENIDRESLVGWLKENNLVYFKYDNGEISNIFLFPIQNLEKSKINFIEKCKEIIRKKWDLETFEEKGKIVFIIHEKRFDPKKAKELGINERKFGKLTSGQIVEKGANTITPAMVHNIIKKKFEVNHHPVKKEIINI